MAQRKYIVRDGFVVVRTLEKNDGSTYTREYVGNEEVTLDDAEAAQHAHKLEYATQKDRDAALAAEAETRVAAQATNSPAELVQALVGALQASLAAAAPAPQAPAA